MKVCIVTVYNSVNCGSFWQAYILGEFLKNQGNDVYYYKRKVSKTSASLKNKVQNCIKALVKSGIKCCINTIAMYVYFSKLGKNFKIIDNTEIGEMDCFILGSDTIWNLDSKYFYNNRDIFFGINFPQGKIISYAASFSNTSFNTINKISDLPKLLNHIDYLSVRDNYSKDIVTNVTNKNCKLVCDPTLLLEKKDYCKYVNPNFNSSKYILLYLFKRINNQQMNEIESYAKTNNLKIIELDVFSNRNVEKKVNEPNNFINFFYYADYIITDTFHGTVFSVNFNKQFVVIDRNKNKVNDFISKCRLNDRVVNNNDIVDILEQKIDFEQVNEILDDFRIESIDFLNKSIRGV